MHSFGDLKVVHNEPLKYSDFRPCHTHNISTQQPYLYNGSLSPWPGATEKWLDTLPDLGPSYEWGSEEFISPIWLEFCYVPHSCVMFLCYHVNWMRRIKNNILKNREVKLLHRYKQNQKSGGRVVLVSKNHLMHLPGLVDTWLHYFP